ncbi:hypothetical protein RFI_36101, partial [Reticulomyxa filosa]
QLSKDVLNADYYETYREALEAITVKLSGKQLDNAFNYFISKFGYEKIDTVDEYADLLKEIAQRLDEKQINIALNCCMDKLNDKNKHQNICIKYIQLLEIISDKCNQQQLNEGYIH